MINEQLFNLEIAPGNRKDRIFTKFEAYVFLLIKIEDEQGIFTSKLYSLAKQWGWSRTKVRNFIEYLEKSSVIELTKEEDSLIFIGEIKDIKKDSKNNSKKDICKSSDFNINKGLKDTKKDIKKDIEKNTNLGNIQDILNM